MPLPTASQPPSVAFGMNTPVLPTIELVPTSPVAWTTPAVSNDWLVAGAAMIDCTYVLAGTPIAAGQ